ncbi:tripartite motif-containing protein 3-like [Ptychodera flava]|uniref:tripartite motif-containing protein 3-like n=1 Tax=Ptychodera flava TaxID=63121 RepID=UPI00396A7994
MASSSDFGEKLLTDIDDKVLLCAICIQRFKSPKILPCQHTFCELCLTEWVKANNGQLICPTCKNQWPLPSGGVPAITSNRFLNDLLEVISEVSPGRSDRACEWCKKEAKHWCGDCGGHFYCNDCLQNHSKVRVLQDHEPMKIEDYNEKMSTQHSGVIQPRFCDNHHSSKLEFYCDTCQVPTCHKCTVVEHPTTNHKMLSLESALEKYRPEMKAHTEKIAGKVSDLKQRKNRAQDGLKDLDANRSTAERQIKSLYQKLIDELKNQEMKLLGEVDKIYIPKSKQINAEIEVLEHRIASAESIHSYLKHLLTFGGAADIMTAQKQMKDQQQHYDNLTNVPGGDIDSDLVFTENPECLKIDLGVVKGNNLTKPGKAIQSGLPRKDGDSMEKTSDVQLDMQKKEESVTIYKHSGNIPLEAKGGRDAGVDKDKQTQPMSLVKSLPAKHDQPIEVHVTKRKTMANKTKQSNLKPCRMENPSGEYW